MITGQDYRDTATTPVYDLVLAMRQRRMRYLGHVLRMPPDRIVRRALVALVKGGTCYPEGSLRIMGPSGSDMINLYNINYNEGSNTIKYYNVTIVPRNNIYLLNST